MTTARFITLEGGEGVGKTTQLHALADALRTRGHKVVTTREPGGSEGAEAIRRLLLEGGEERWSARAEALLFAAARAAHVDQTIRPALTRGEWVICDRFLDSSLAYQGGAGGLGMDAVRAINLFGIEDCLPERTLLLLHAEGAERARARDGEQSDRIGGRPPAYHQAVESAFLELAEKDPRRIRAIDASGTPEMVTERLLGALGDLL